MTEHVDYCGCRYERRGNDDAMDRGWVNVGACAAHSLERAS